MERKFAKVPEPTLRRLPLYHHYLKRFLKIGRDYISCTHIGKDLGFTPVQVRKDLAFTGIRGLPKVGYQLTEIVKSIEAFLGWNLTCEAFLVGVGHLGKALLGYKGFDRYGFNFVAAFDRDFSLHNQEINKTKILPVEKLENLIRRMKVKIGVITVPEEYAQEVADQMVSGGICAIWNFAPIDLNVPEGIIVKNEIIASGLAVLNTKLQNSMNQFQEGEK
jgi:redox-sensing transcriptional repressor